MTYKTSKNSMIFYNAENERIIIELIINYSFLAETCFIC